MIAFILSIDFANAGHMVCLSVGVLAYTLIMLWAADNMKEGSGPFPGMLLVWAILASTFAFVVQSCRWIYEHIDISITP